MEFDIIQRFFIEQSSSRADVILGSGDDCAVVSVPNGHELVLTIDTMVEGVHFVPSTSASDIGYKSVAVSLSDLAAMGAQPAWATVALTVPRADDDWFKQFSQGLFDCLSKFDVQLIGGDLTRGPLAISSQLHGFVPNGQAITRAGAQIGDQIYLVGSLGSAALALAHLQGKLTLSGTDVNKVLPALNRPCAQVQAGLLLRELATSCIDISDGLAADLGHICQASGCGALIDVDHLPLSTPLKRVLPPDQARTLALSGGDDYALCFTIPKHKKALLQERFAAHDIMGCCIGEVVSGAGIECRHQNGQVFNLTYKGWEHF